MGSGASALNNRPLTSSELFDDSVLKILEIIAPGKDLEIERSEEARLIKFGGGWQKGLRKNLSKVERTHFLNALAFVSNFLANGDDPRSLNLLTIIYTQNTREHDYETTIPLEVVVGHFIPSLETHRERLEPALEKLEKIQNYAFYLSNRENKLFEIDPLLTIKASAEEITAGVKSYHDNRAFEDLKDDIKVGTSLHVDDHLAWLEERGFPLQKVEEEFSLVRFAVRHGTQQSLVKHLAETLQCDMSAKDEIFRDAAQYSSLETVEYLSRKFPPQNQEGILLAALSAYFDVPQNKKTERDQVVAFLINKDFPIDKEAHEFLRNHVTVNSNRASDFIMTAVLGMVATAKELAKKSCVGDLLEVLTYTKSEEILKLAKTSLEKIRDLEKEIKPEETEMTSPISCKIDFELMSHPVRICNLDGAPIFPHTYNKKNIETHLENTKTNPSSGEKLPENYQLLTNNEIMGEILDYFSEKYKPVVEELISKNSPLRAYELLDSLNEDALRDYEKHLDKKLDEENAEEKGEDAETKNKQKKELEEKRQIPRDLVKWYGEKIEQILEMTRKIPVSTKPNSPSAESLATQHRER